MKEEQRRYIYETLMSAKQALLGITGEESMTEFRRKLEENRTELTDRIERAICIIQEPEKYFKECSAPAPMEDEQKEQKPAEWSEEDSKRYISIGTTLETSVVLSKEDYDANMAWLRELVNAKKYSGPRPSWKPSEEQMKALLNAEGYLREGDQFDSAKSIAQLYEQLKKL